MLTIIICYKLSDFSKKAQCHWRVVIEKEFIAHNEFVKAKEIEGSDKRYFGFMIFTYLVKFVYKITRQSVLPLKTFQITSGVSSLEV